MVVMCLTKLQAKSNNPRNLVWSFCTSCCITCTYPPNYRSWTTVESASKRQGRKLLIGHT